MQVRPITKHTIILLFALTGAISGCYYDNEEELYPVTNQAPCDTAAVTLSAVVKPILNQHCIGCHNAGFASGGVDLETYTQLASSANSGKLLSSVKHDGKASPMPKGSPKLDECSIHKIEKWIRLGAKND